MHTLTKKYVQVHLIYLQYLQNNSLSEELLEYDSLYDHMHAFFLNIGLSEKDAWLIIDDLREKSNV